MMTATLYFPSDRSLKFYSVCKQDEALLNRTERRYVFFMKPNSSRVLQLKKKSKFLRTVLDCSLELSIVSR